MRGVTWLLFLVTSNLFAAKTCPPSLTLVLDQRLVEAKDELTGKVLIENDCAKPLDLELRIWIEGIDVGVVSLGPKGSVNMSLTPQYDAEVPIVADIENILNDGFYQLNVGLIDQITIKTYASASDLFWVGKEKVIRDNFDRADSPKPGWYWLTNTYDYFSIINKRLEFMSHSPFPLEVDLPSSDMTVSARLYFGTINYGTLGIIAALTKDWYNGFEFGYLPGAKRCIIKRRYSGETIGLSKCDGVVDGSLFTIKLDKGDLTATVDGKTVITAIVDEIPGPVRTGVFADCAKCAIDDFEILIP